MRPMRRSLVACAALFLACNSAPTDNGKTAPTKAADAKPGKPDAKAKPDVKAPDAKAPDAKAPEPDVEAPEPTPTPPPVKLEPATTELLDRLVPAADRVAVSDATAKPLEIKAEESQLFVVEGSRRAPLGRRGDAINGVTLSHDAGGEPVLRVDYEDSVFCGDTKQLAEIPARNLLARLENASGLEHEGKGKGGLEAAAKAFAQAVLLDPTLDEAWTSLARVLAKQGDTASAMAALDPLLRRAPLATYHQVLSDRELASLREQPAITAVRAPKAGDAKLRKLTIAYSAHHSLVAMVRTEQSWGACNYVQELRLHSTTSGEELLSLPLAGFDETDTECAKAGGPGKVLPKHRAAVNARFDMAERFLQDMGFSVSPGLELVDPPKVPGEDYITKAQLPGAGLEIEIGESTVKVRKGTEVIVDRKQNDAQSIDSAGYDPAAHVAFIEWHQQVPEGCAFEGDGVGYYVFPVPASK